MTEAPAAAPLDIKTLKPLIDRNADALAAAGIKKPMSLLNQLQKTREPITLPDGAVLEPSPLSKPGRKLVILGDTYDASGAQSIAMDADLVVHESTNAFLPTIPRFTAPEETLESAQAYSRERGHSTPELRRRIGTGSDATDRRRVREERQRSCTRPQPPFCTLSADQRQSGCVRGDGVFGLVRLRPARRRRVRHDGLGHSPSICGGRGVIGLL